MKILMWKVIADFYSFFGLKKNASELFPLKVGDKLPDHELVDHVGNNVKIYDYINDEPAIVKFYRGTWCPFCSTELREYNELLNQDEYKNVNLLAISPEEPDYSLRSEDIEKLNMRIFSDTENKYAQKLRLVHSTSSLFYKIDRFNNVNKNRTKKRTGYELPIPATYVVDKNKIIRYAWISDDYKYRAYPPQVMTEWEKINRSQGNN